MHHARGEPERTRRARPRCCLTVVNTSDVVINCTLMSAMIVATHHSFQREFPVCVRAMRASHGRPQRRHKESGHFAFPIGHRRAKITSCSGQFFLHLTRRPKRLSCHRSRLSPARNYFSNGSERGVDVERLSCRAVIKSFASSTLRPAAFDI